MELKICEGDFGLASLDCECLQLLLFAKVAKMNLIISTSNRKFPVLISKNGLNQYQSFEKIATCLKTWKLDLHLNKQDIKIIPDFKLYIKNVLKPIILYLYWINEVNYENFTIPWFRKSQGLIFKYVYLPELKKNAWSYIFSCCPEGQFQNIEEILMKHFTDLCRMLILHCRQSLFLFATKEPSSLDIIVYSYLAIITKIPFPCNEFGVKIRQQYVELYGFVERIDRIYFPEIRYEEKYFKIMDAKTIGNKNRKIDVKKYAAVITFCGWLFFSNVYNYLEIK